MPFLSSGSAAPVFKAPKARPAVPARRACAFVFIANLPHLVEAYGLDFAISVSCEVKRRLCASFLTSVQADLACLRDDCFLLWSNDAFANSEPRPQQPASAELEMLLAIVGGEPIHALGMTAMAQLHADWIEMRPPEQLGASEIELTLWTAQPFPDSQENYTDGWRQFYRADMDVAVRVSEALQAERLDLAWRPVVDAYALETTFYRQAHPRFAPRPGQPASLAPEVFMPCLQRLGLVRVFDRLAVRLVLDALRRQPSARMAVSVFAQSARIDHWWASLLSALQSEPSLAARLIVEISDGMEFSNLESVRDFCIRLRSLGCRIAIKGFGAGTGNLTAMQACRPDIVKLEAAFLRRARESDFGRECLRGMLALCAHLASHVVVDGVEREEDMHVASEAGAQWLQGYYLRDAEEAFLPASRTQPLQRSLA
ncbi:EAL domain-containing protein [Variovorax boronicumulans]|uniref:EAL domain-containing protein n=1 Tax=Variovorax boronicumulans TaxID=436515 RepID=UPI002472FFA0|nr:EAL domain-containing protein [Variovorax boronicumulans]